MVAMSIAKTEVKASKTNRGRCSTSKLEYNKSINMMSLVTRGLNVETNNIIKVKIKLDKTIPPLVVMVVHISRNTIMARINDKIIKDNIRKDLMTGTIQNTSRCLPKHFYTTFMAIVVLNIIKITIASFQNQTTGLTTQINIICQVRIKVNIIQTIGATTESLLTTMGVILILQATIIDSSRTTIIKVLMMISKRTVAMPVGVRVLMKGCNAISTSEEVTHLPILNSKVIFLSSNQMDHNFSVLGKKLWTIRITLLKAGEK